ncbi:MAG: GldG family protein [Promethearchaeota archaeon]
MNENEIDTREPRSDMDMTTPDGESQAERRAFRSGLVSLLAGLEERGVLFLYLGLLALLAGGAWYAIGKNLDDWVRGLLAGGLVAIAIYLLLRPQDLRRVLTGRSTRYGSNALILSVAVIGILVLLNYLSNRYYKRIDATEDNLHSLSPQSIQVLEELDRDVEVVGVYPGGQGQEQFEEWLDEYRAHTGRIQYRTIDPVRQPGEADQLGWGAGSGLLVRRRTRSQQVLTPDEQNITSALLKVSRDVSKVIYFTTGHKEPSPTDYQQVGYGQVGSLLEDNNYQVRTLNLAIVEAVPADAAIVVVAGPETTLLQEEEDRLRSYLLDGGKALIMIDPGEETGINDVLSPWKIQVENKLVVDLLWSLPGDPLTPAIDRYRFGQITKDLPTIVLPLARPIRQGSTGEPEIVFTSLAVTSDRSWAEADMEGEGEIEYDEGSDLPGPLTLIATVESPAAGGSEEKIRLVLIGDSDFLTNGFLDQVPTGRFLLLNAVNWLAEEESLIAIPPKTYARRSVQMNVVQEGVVCFGTLILIPGLIVLAGVAVWLKRR